MNPPVKPARRSFLLTVALGASATAAIVARHSQKILPQPGAKEESSERGYQLSAHVRKYYRSAKV